MSFSCSRCHQHDGDHREGCGEMGCDYRTEDGCLLDYGHSGPHETYYSRKVAGLEVTLGDWRAMGLEFLDRCARGEVRGRYTRGEIERLLARNTEEEQRWVKLREEGDG